MNIIKWFQAISWAKVFMIAEEMHGKDMSESEI